MKIGIIGDGKHATRIKRILKKNNYKFFIYKPDAPKYYDIKKYNDLKKCKIIFILTPNNTHYTYLRDLYKNRYIFCEKPPVTKNSHLKYLSKINISKVYFNFNFRFSILADILNKVKKHKLGNLIYANINLTHGYGLTEEYKKDWRSKKNKNNLGIYEMVLIHYLDLINYYFNLKKNSKVSLKKISNLGSSYDTCNVRLETNNAAQIDLFASYSTAFYRNIFFIFNNGYILQDEKEIKIFGPAINKDKNNKFIKPEIKEKIKINYFLDYEKSLEKSVNFFLKTARKKKKFNNFSQYKSLESNEILINSKY